MNENELNREIKYLNDQVHCLINAHETLRARISQAFSVVKDELPAETQMQLEKVLVAIKIPPNFRQK